MYFASVERAQLCFTIIEHWHQYGRTDSGLTKIHLVFIVSDYYTVPLSLDRSECTFCCHFIKMLIEKVIHAVFRVCFSTLLFCLFLWCKSRDACPYFSFRHHHLACLYCPNSLAFFFFFFSSASYSWPTIPYPPPVSLSLRWCWAEVSPCCGVEQQERERSCCSPDLGALREGRHDPNMSASTLALVLLQNGLELQLSSAMTALWSQCQTGCTVREEEADCGAFDYWCTKQMRGLQLITAVTVRTGSVEWGRCSVFVESPVFFKPARLFVCLRGPPLPPWAAGQGRAVGVGVGAVGRTWESGLNSRHSLTSEATLCLVCLLYNLSYILCVFVRVLCQTHWLWKNNLTGFNLLPPSSFLFPPSPRVFLFFFFSFFFCVPLRGWEFILFGNSMPSPSLLCKLERPGFMAALRSTVMCGSSLQFTCHMWC